MYWKQEAPEFDELPESEIASELIEGLERYTSDAELLKVRFRWRPFSHTVNSFITKDSLLDIGSASNLDIARAVSSYARHLWQSGECESRFEAQIFRQLHQDVGDEESESSPRPVREWRSITFYVANPNPEPATPMTTHFNEPDNELDESDDTVEDDGEDEFEHDPPPALPARRVSSRPVHVPPGRRTSQSVIAPDVEARLFGKYRGWVELAQNDPTAFAMLVTLQSGDRTIETLERLLHASFDRFDRTLEHHGSHSRFINEALETLTGGAGEVASIGLDLFRTGLEQQARVTQLNHDTEIGKERTELMRDAVKQGSLLVQGVLMSNAAKSRQAQTKTSTEPRPSPATPTPATPSPAAKPPLSPEEAELAAADDRFIEMRARQLLEVLTPERIEQLRPYAPTLAPTFERLRSQPITAAWVRRVILEAQADVDPNELQILEQHLDTDVRAKITTLLMRIMSSGDLS